MRRMSAPREIHAAAAGQLEGALGLDALVGSRGLSPDRRQTFALRLDRDWPDLEAAVTEVHPDPEVAGALLDPLLAPRRAAYAARPATCTSLDERRLAARTGSSGPRCSATPRTPTGSPATSPASPSTSTT